MGWRLVLALFGLSGQWLIHSRIHPFVDWLIRSLSHSVVDSFATLCWVVAVSLINRLIDTLTHSSDEPLIASLINTLADSLMGALIDSANLSSLIDEWIRGWIDWRCTCLIDKIRQMWIILTSAVSRYSLFPPVSAWRKFQLPP